jgi:hypothetical protein
MEKRWAGRREYWQELIERQQSSGLNITEFCSREGVHTTSFHTWRTKLGMKPEPVSKPEKPGGFFEIAVLPEAASSSLVSVECPGHITIHINSHDGDILRQVLATAADVFGR